MYEIGLASNITLRMHTILIVPTQEGAQKGCGLQMGEMKIQVII